MSITSLLPSRVTLENGISLDLLCQNGRFAGLGQVTVGDLALRSGRRPLFVEIRNPSGILLRDYQVSRQTVTPERVELALTMHREDGGLMEWMVHEVRNRVNTADWTDEPRLADGTTLTLILKPVTRHLAGETFTGFSYQYLYQSPDIPIYKLIDRGTWELGGQAVGNEFWMRNCFSPPIVPITSPAQFHSTEWYLPGCTNPNIFQFLPLQTELQGFSFLAGSQGALVTWATGVAHIRSLFEKPRGKDELVHWHEHCGDLAHTFQTAPMEVLVSRGDFDQAARINLYGAVAELVHETLHAELGMARERVTTYGQIEEWGRADLERYRTLGLPKLLESGAKTIYVANHFENNMNVWGVSNMCCTVDHKIAETVGEDKLRAFCTEAKAAGAQVEMWGNTAVSTLTWIFDSQDGSGERIRFLPAEDSVMAALKTAKSPWVRNPSNAIEADHYTPVFAALNLCDPVVYAYWLRRWQAAHDEVGLEGIFLDSSFNMSSDKFHYEQWTEAARSGATADQTDLLGNYRPALEPPQAIRSQYQAHLELMTAMQRMGIHYCTEDLGVFGTHRHGPGVEARVDNLFLWSDCLCGFDVPALRAIGADPAAVYFRGLAYRQMWMLHWDIQRDTLSFNYAGLRSDDDRPTTWHLSLLQAYNRVTDQMCAREVLPYEAGVIYRSDGALILWAFTDLEFPLERGGLIEDVLAGTTEEAASIAATRHRVYRVTG
jgi:hypothetical protein